MATLVDDGDPANTYIPTSGWDELRHAGGGRRAGAMARPFFNYLLDNVPGGGLIPAISRQDTFGCEVGFWGRMWSGFTGAMGMAGPILHIGSMMGGAANIFEKDLALGLATSAGRTPQGEMQIYLHLKNGAESYYTFGNPTEFASEMERARSIHFNMNGFEPGKVAEGWTQKEWEHLLNNPPLHGKSTVYNPPPGVQIPPTIRTGPNFPPYPRR